jgi:dTDP-4-amino-4,6-dideoxygalactose transaminase
MKAYIPGHTVLSPRLLFEAIRLKQVNIADNVQFFGYARYALAEIVKHEDLSKNTLYVPSYICSEALLALTGTGPTIDYYPVNTNLEPGWEWLSQKVHPGDVLLLVHYFGFSNALNKALSFCKSYGLMLIEDCAHSFLTRREGKLLGTFGDYGIYSYRKLLPLLDGGGLVSRRPGFEGSGSLSSSTFRPSSMRTLVKQVLKFGAFKVRLPVPPLHMNGRANNETNGAELVQTQTLDHRMTALSYRLLLVLKTEYPTIALLRRRNYAALLNAFSQFPEVSLPYTDLAEEVCPQVFPMLVDNQEEVLRVFYSHSIPAQTWPFLPARIKHNSNYPTANWLQDHLILLPVYQDLHAKHVERMITAYRNARQRVVSNKVGRFTR